MQIILLEKIVKLGELGEEVTVRDGYARNYLLPFGKALPATEANRKHFEERRAELEARALEQKSAAEQRAAALEKLEVITISAHAAEGGKLFGSVGPQEIAKAATEAGVPLDRKEILLADGVFRSVGTYQATIRLHSELQLPVTIAVISE